MLTAGHCTYDDEGVPWAEYGIRAGISSAAPFGQPQEQRREVVEVRRHPDYVAGTFAHDVALLTVEPPFEFSTPDVQPIPVAPTGTLLPGTTAEFFGWGDIAPEVSSGVEHALVQTIIRSWQCGRFQGLASFSCRQSATGSPCAGDSGSGVVAGSPPELVGVVSVSAGCRAGVLGGGPDLTTPELEAWLAGNQNPPRAPQALTLPLITGGTRSGEEAECKPATWTGFPALQAAFVEPAAGVLLQEGSSASIVIPPAALGQELACVSIATGPGGTTEALSANTITVGAPAPVPARPTWNAGSLVKVVKRSVQNGRWHLILAVAGPEVGRKAGLLWTAGHCVRCRARRTVTLRSLTKVTSPLFATTGVWTVTVSVPAAETSKVRYRAGTRTVHLGRLVPKRGN